MKGVLDTSFGGLASIGFSRQGTSQTLRPTWLVEAADRDRVAASQSCPTVDTENRSDNQLGPLPGSDLVVEGRSIDDRVESTIDLT